MGITLGNFRGLAHPSEPNYVGAGGGDTWGLLSDDFVYAPAKWVVFKSYDQRFIMISQRFHNRRPFRRERGALG